MGNYIVFTTVEVETPLWNGGTPEEQGYSPMVFPKLKRLNAKYTEYYVYKNEKEFASIEADSAMNAASISKIQEPHKILHVHARIADVVHTNQLECEEGDIACLNKKEPFVRKDIIHISENMTDIPVDIAAMVPAQDIQN